MPDQIVISLIIGYGFGCIQSAYLIGRLVGKIDIREHGSGNAGASNTTTMLGLRYGALVGLIDILKGTLAVLMVKGIFPGDQNLPYLAGMAAILGHIFPFYLGFRGGKGVATLVGVMTGLDWKLGILFALLVLIPALLTDYIVSGSFSTFLALPIVTWLRGYPLVFTAISIGLAILCFYLHRENIRRIMRNEELKISSVLKRKKS